MNNPSKTELSTSPRCVRTFLERHGLKITPQRLVIAEYLLATTSHPTADEVFQAMESRLPAISKATVYNTLNTMVEAGFIRTVSVETGVTRYDANLEPHHHFVDATSGRILDLPWEHVQELCHSLGPDFKVHDYQITFYGECQNSPEHAHSPPN